MDEYTIEIRETLKTTVKINAENKNEALNIASEQYVDGEIILDYDNYYGENSINLKEQFSANNLIEACQLFLTDNTKEPLDPKLLLDLKLIINSINNQLDLLQR